MARRSFLHCGRSDQAGAREGRRRVQAVFVRHRSVRSSVAAFPTAGRDLRAAVHRRQGHARADGHESRHCDPVTMPKITIYQKPTCTTCRQVYNALKESGVDFDAVDYYTDPIPKAKLKELLRKMGMRASDLLRTKEPVYKKLKLAD